jgi:hypothetical protein
VTLLNGRAKSAQSQDLWEVQTIKKLTQLKVAIINLYGLFAVLVGLGHMWKNDAVTFAGLMAFTVAAALLTFYIVETQP